jgi:gp16 family phage-associated protein
MKNRSGPTLKTAAEVRALFLETGVSVTDWAESHGFDRHLVYEVLRGQRLCARGKSHEIAVALGMKRGRVVRDPRKALEAA